MSAELAIEPTVARSPFAMPFTSQVTDVVVDVVEFARFTTAVKVVVVFKGTVIEVGVIVTEVTVVVLLLPPPQLAIVHITAITAATIASKRALASKRVRGPRGSWVLRADARSVIAGRVSETFTLIA